MALKTGTRTRFDDDEEEAARAEKADRRRSNSGVLDMVKLVR